MTAYEPPTQNLAIFDPDVFTQNDEPLTITTGSKYFLKYPNAQGTENLQAVNVNGVLTANSTSNFKNQVQLNGATGTDRQITASFYNLTDSGGVGGNGGRLFQSGNQIVLNNFTNNAPIIIRPTDGTSTLQTVIDVDTTSVDTKRPLLMNDTTSTTNRSITSSFYNFYDSSSAGTITQNGTLYNQSGNMYLQNTTNGGTINFYLNDAVGTLTTPLQLLTTGNLSNRPFTISANNNLQMNAGTGRINQSITTGDISTRNTFKLSEFTFNSNVGTGGATAFEFYDSVNGKGLFILPNAGNGSLSQINRQNDCCLTSRSTENNNSIVVSNWNTNMRNGLKVGTTDISNCFVQLNCGQNSTNDYTEFRMAYDRSGNLTTTTFNNVINFNPPTATGLPNVISSARRRLEGLGTLSFTDISGNNTTTGSVVSRIWTDSSLVNSLNGMYYDCGINGGFHQFSARDNAGNVSTPIYYGSNITSVSNTFIVRNPTITSNRFDIVGDTSQNTFIRGRSTTASTEAHIHINCDSVDASGATTNNAVLNITPFYINYRRPIQFNYSTTPSAVNQLGFLVGTTMASVNVASSTNIRNITTYTFTSAGTYLINWGVFANMNSGTATFTDFEIGIANTATNTFNTYTQTFTSYKNLIRTYPTLTTTSDLYEPTSCVYVASSGSIAYFNYLANYTGGTNIIIGGYYTITRIG